MLLPLPLSALPSLVSPWSPRGAAPLPSGDPLSGECHAGGRGGRSKTVQQRTHVLKISTPTHPFCQLPGSCSQQCAPPSQKASSLEVLGGERLSREIGRCFCRALPLVTPTTGYVSVRFFRYPQGSMFRYRYCLDAQGPNPSCA